MIRYFDNQMCQSSQFEEIYPNVHADQQMIELWTLITSDMDINNL